MGGLQGLNVAKANLYGTQRETILSAEDVGEERRVAQKPLLARRMQMELEKRANEAQQQR